jgi:HPt (histidine-containing phosphotransfer) domain-containing protein
MGAAWFDRDALVSAYGGRQQHLGKLLRSYLQEGPKTLAALCNAVARGDAARIESTAHQVAGELLRLHARPVAAIARQIERAAATGRVQGVLALMSVLEAAAQQLLVAVVPLAVYLERSELAAYAERDEEIVLVIDDDFSEAA